LVLAAVCFLVAGVLALVTHYTGGSAGEAFSKLPLWLDHAHRCSRWRG
jgi:hypothetical protein